MLSLSEAADTSRQDNPGTEAADGRSEMLVFSRESGLAAYLHSLVHPTARSDAGTLARHQAFIVSRLFAGLVAACVFPVTLMIAGAPSLLGAMAFLWLLSPIAIAVFLSCTGRFARAHLISAANFAGILTFCAWLTGGLSSVLLAWFVVVPVDAGLSGDRRVVAWGAAVSAIGIGVLTLCGVAGFAPPPFAAPGPVAVFAVIGAATGMVCASGLVMLIQTIQRRPVPVSSSGDARYRLLAETMSDMITQHDEKGRVVFASPAARSLLGIPVRQVLGDGLFERVHVGDRPAYLSALSRCRANCETISVAFRVRRSASGTVRYAWVEMSCRPLPAMDGGIVGVTRDVTAHKDREAALSSARTDAERASLAKTRFLANMSHELRTPLNAIIGFSEILDSELFGALGEERYRDYAGLIHQSGVHLLNVVNDILDMSKIEAGKFSILKAPFDACVLVKSCCDIVRHAADQKELSLEVDIPRSMPQLNADERACKQMLLNVLSNAVKFTEAGGRVSLSVSVAGGNVVFAVSDNGIGIAEQDLPRLGDPFVQTTRSYERRYEGAGLGLSVVRGLVRLHGGKLDIASTLGQGTCVRISLPLEPQSHTTDRTSETRAASAA